MQGYLPRGWKELEVVSVSGEGLSREEALPCPAPPVWSSGSVGIWTPLPLRPSPCRACPWGVPVQCILSAELWGQGRGSDSGAASDKTELVLR